MKNKSKNKNLQGGFAPFLIIAIIAILAIGGGAYVVIKNKEKNAQTGDNLNTQANAEADANANVNANLGVNANAKGSLRSLLGMGRNTMCTFTSTAGGTTSSGTVYISADGMMRGDFSAGGTASSMMVKSDNSYFWSGAQGVKMNKTSTNTSASGGAKSSVDLDSQVDYKCGNWTRDESKFTVPSGVQFLDVGAMMKGSGGVKLNY